MKKNTQNQKVFNPLIFLSSLGAGGIAVIPFVLMQYTIPHGEGLIHRPQVWEKNLDILNTIYYMGLEAIMIIFAVLHIGLTIYLLKNLFIWIKNKEYKQILEEPTKNAILVTPILSLLMTMNVFIGPIRYFIPWMVSNLQSLFLPAFIFWIILFVILISLEIYFLKILFEKNVDFDSLNFGWLLHPFTLGMLTVVGTGISAMSKNHDISNAAMFLSLIAASLGLFLFVVKFILMIKKQIISPSLPDKQFLPSFLIVVPIITLYSISFFRIARYLEHTKDMHHSDIIAYLSIGLGFGFEVWYLIFGLILLKDYFKRHHFNDYYVTQWGLICPFVAFSVLGAFAYNIIYSSSIIYMMILLSMIFVIFLYIEILYKAIKSKNI